MKKANFYPRQVLRRLRGEHALIDAGQRAALVFLLRRSRKLGYTVTVGPTTTAVQLAGAANGEAAQVILASAPTRIALYPAI